MSTIDDLTEQEQRLIAADFAAHVLPLFEADYPDDDRPRKAIEAARAFARGEVTRTQLEAARAAAEAAAWAAVGAAAWAAAWAAARAAARDAAEAASWAAVGAAARAVAEYAAWDAAGAAAGAAAEAAARAAARAAEREWQQDRIFEVVAARAQEQPAPSVAVFRARLLDKWGIAQLDIDHLIDAVRREARQGP